MANGVGQELTRFRLAHTGTTSTGMQHVTRRVEATHDVLSTCALSSMCQGLLLEFIGVLRALSPNGVSEDRTCGQESSTSDQGSMAVDMLEHVSVPDVAERVFSWCSSCFSWRAGHHLRRRSH